MSVKRIVDILCYRDGVSIEDATRTVEETRRLMDDCNYDPIECEDIMAEMLGLEPDYLFDLLF